MEAQGVSTGSASIFNRKRKHFQRKAQGVFSVRASVFPLHCNSLKSLRPPPPQPTPGVALSVMFREAQPARLSH